LAGSEVQKVVWCGTVPVIRSVCRGGMGDFDRVDAWIEKLWNCEPLPEEDVAQLCDKVELCFALMLSRLG